MTIKVSVRDPCGDGMFCILTTSCRYPGCDTVHITVLQDVTFGGDLGKVYSIST